MSKKKQPKTFFEVYQSIRRDWNGINPVTKIQRDKTKYQRHNKHRQKDFDFS